MSPTSRHARPALVEQECIERTRIRDAREEEVAQRRPADHEGREPGLGRERLGLSDRRVACPQRLAEPFERAGTRATDADRESQRTGDGSHTRKRPLASTTVRARRPARRRAASAPRPAGGPARAGWCCRPGRRGPPRPSSRRADPAATRSSAPGSAAATRPSPRPRAQNRPIGPAARIASATGIAAAGLSAKPIPAPTSAARSQSRTASSGRRSMSPRLKALARRTLERRRQPEARPGPEPADAIDRRALAALQSRPPRSPARPSTTSRPAITRTTADRVPARRGAGTGGVGACRARS